MFYITLALFFPKINFMTFIRVNDTKGMNYFNGLRKKHLKEILIDSLPLSHTCYRTEYKLIPGCITVE